MQRSATPFEIEWKGLTLTGTAVYYPGDPGRYYGPPEHCYPSEPAEIEICSLKYGDKDVWFLLDAEDIANEISDCIMETYEVEDIPDYEPEDPFTDAEADADTLKSAGMGTDEDYGNFGDQDGN